MPRGHPLAGVGLDIEVKRFDFAMEDLRIVRLSTGFSPQVVALVKPVVQERKMKSASFEEPTQGGHGAIIAVDG